MMRETATAGRPIRSRRVQPADVGCGADEALRGAAPHFLEGAPDQDHYGLHLCQPLKLDFLIVSKIVQNLAALVQERNNPIDFRACDVDPAPGGNPFDPSDAAP